MREERVPTEGKKKEAWCAIVKSKRKSLVRGNVKFACGWRRKVKACLGKMRQSEKLR